MEYIDRVHLMFSQSAEDEKDLLHDYTSSPSMRSDDEAQQSNDDRRYSFRLIEQSSYTPPNMRVSLSWTNVCASSESKQLLSTVSGIAKPGELLAIMGKSAISKTLLLNILGGRSVPGNVHILGDVEMNGFPLKPDYVRRFTGFVYQEDIFPALLTVWEYLWFHAKLRMTGDKITDKIRSARVEALLMELNLAKCSSCLIGGSGKSLSGGERKRLALATELIINPAVILLDEPTLGLRNYLAESVFQSLSSLAKEAAKTIVFTIEQPCSQIFSLFDRLLLLSPDGRVCFQGTTGDCRRFFESPPIMQPCRVDFSCADVYMDLIYRQYRDKPDFIIGAYKTSEYSRIVATDIEAAMGSNFFTVGPTFNQLSEIKPAGLAVQLQMTSWRAVKLYYRNSALIQIRMARSTLYTLIVGLIFFGLKLDPTGVANRCGALIQMVGVIVWQNISHYLNVLPKERCLLVRECTFGLYPPWGYFLTRQLVELPFVFFLTLINTTTLYMLTFLWETTGLSGWWTASKTGFLIALSASSIGYVLGFSTESRNRIVRTVFYPILTIQVLCNGFWINNESIPKYLSWLPYMSFFYYGSENMFIAEWGNGAKLQQECDQKTKNKCFRNGTEVLEYYNFDANHLWRNFWLLLILTIILRLLALVILTHRTKRTIGTSYTAS